MNNKTICLQCGQQITGRSDKKFCDSYCRNTYNNQVKREHEQMMIDVNKILRKNRSILIKVNPHGKTTIRKEYLDIAGFDFRYFTHLYKTQKGFIYKICYDMGYMPVDDEKILIVNWQPYMEDNFKKDLIIDVNQ